jgi:Tetracyclin repressor-like, C-terminal domain
MDLLRRAGVQSAGQGRGQLRRLQERSELPAQSGSVFPLLADLLAPYRASSGVRSSSGSSRCGYAGSGSCPTTTDPDGHHAGPTWIGRRAPAPEELDPDVDFAFVSDLLTGPIVYKTLVRGEQLADDDAQRTVDMVIAADGRANRRSTRA